MYFQIIEDIEQVKNALKNKGVCFGHVNPNKYHAWKDELENCISKSSLKDFVRNPYVFRQEALLGRKKDSPALRKGRLIDCLLLTPDLFSESYVVEEVNKRTTAGRERVKEIEASGRELVSPEEHQQAIEAVEEAEKTLQDIVYGATLHTQVALWVRIDSIGMKILDAPVILCGMIDILIEHESTFHIFDLKTTSINLNDEREIQENIVKFDYLTQAAIYTDLLRAATGKEVTGASLLYLSSEAPFQTRIVRFSDNDIIKTCSRYLQQIDLFATACATSTFGSSRLPDMVFSLPAWAEKKQNKQ